jgi:hypothetical protein
MTTTAPVFTLQERDRRWARIRAFMAERNLAGLVIAGLRGREGFEPYVSNESIQGVVVFPADGDPVHLTWNAFRILGRDDPGNDREYWIDDIRARRRGRPAEQEPDGTRRICSACDVESCR